MNRRAFIAEAAMVGTSALVCGAACGAEAIKTAERKDCAHKAVNEEKCTCKNATCPNHGICCLCVLAHRAQKNLPACLR